VDLNGPDGDTLKVRKRLLGWITLLAAVMASSLSLAVTAHAASQDGWFTLGYSAQNRPIDAIRLGSGATHLALMGSIHGGWERNTEQLVRQAYEYFAAHPEEIPQDLSLFFVPTSNPDGLAAGDDRESAWNANGVDLNRNFDTPNWSPDTYGRVGGRYGPTGARVGAGGSEPFSEPETRVIRAFIIDERIDAVLSYHSGIWSVTTRDGGGDPAEPIALQVAAAMGYPYIRDWTEYALTGQFMDWLAGIGVKGIEVDLPNQRDIDWDRNLAGIRVVIAALGAADDRGTTP
jgi:hypothetical protein